MAPQPNAPRGIRNNNPGNIRRGQTLWQGEAPAQTDADFLVFAEPVWGLRAIARILLHYQAEGLATVRQMVGRWAPPSENDTASYMLAVSTEVGAGPDAPLELASNPVQLGHFVEAIVRHENGQQPYPQDLIAKAVGLALP